MKNKNHIFISELWINKPKEELFEFFSNASNLNLVTPKWLSFEILTPTPIFIKRGTIIDYRLKLHKFPIKWKTKITNWEPPFRFVDSQIKGPYKTWIHEHKFVDQKNGTLMIDTVEYKAPGRIFEPLINFLFVRRDVKRIFQYREQQFSAIFQGLTK